MTSRSSGWRRSGSTPTAGSAAAAWRAGSRCFPAGRRASARRGLEIATGTVRRGDATVAARTAGSVWCELPSFDSKVYTGNDVWKILSGGAALKGEFGGPAFLAADEGGPRFSGGEGAVRVRVALRDGAGKAAAELTARHAKVRTKARTIRGTVVVDVRRLRNRLQEGRSVARPGAGWSCPTCRWPTAGRSTRGPRPSTPGRHGWTSTTARWMRGWRAGSATRGRSSR